MQVLRRAALAMAFTLPLAALPLSAQFYKWDFNVNGGYSWLTGDMFDRNDFDVFDDFEDPRFIFDRDNSVSLGNGGTVGAQLGYWFTKRFGLRANFAYTDSDIERRDDLLFDPDLNIFDFGLFDHDVNLWSGTGDILVRLNTPRTRWDGFEWLPYVALGLGAQWINPAGSGFSVIDNIDLDLDGDLDGFIDVSGDEGIPIRCSITTLVLPRTCAFLKEGSTLAGLVAVGMDLRVAPSFAVRLEFGDRIYQPDVVRVVQDDLFPFVFAEVGGDLGSTINQLYLTAGASFLFGLRPPPARVVVAPPPRPAPPPPPPPSTEEITVCVVDPTYAGGVRNITATRNLSTGDTTVMKNGDKVQLHDAVGNVPTASNSTWYISGAPLTIGMAPNSINYLTVGGARNIEPNDLAFLGTINGLPAFADRMTLAPVLMNLGPNTDLNRLVMESEAARHALDTVSVIYVPLQPTGCVFQALQKQVEVRKK